MGMPLWHTQPIYLMQIEMHGHLQFVHNLTLSMTLSNREYCFITLPLSVLFRLILATCDPTLPVCTNVRGADVASWQLYSPMAVPTLAGPHCKNCPERAQGIGQRARLIMAPIECQNKSDSWKPHPARRLHKHALTFQLSIPIHFGFNMSARTQGFPGECCIVTIRSVLLTSPISGFNVVAYLCISLSSNGVKAFLVSVN